MAKNAESGQNAGRGGNVEDEIRILTKNLLIASEKDGIATDGGKQSPYSKEVDSDQNGVKDVDEDKNGNGIKDGDEDKNNNGIKDRDEDKNGNGILDSEEDLNGNGVKDGEETPEPSRDDRQGLRDLFRDRSRIIIGLAILLIIAGTALAAYSWYRGDGPEDGADDSGDKEAKPAAQDESSKDQVVEEKRPAKKTGKSKRKTRW
jgi:hypothetical protein